MTAPEAMDAAIKIIEQHFGEWIMPDEVDRLLEQVVQELRLRPLEDRAAATRISRQAQWAFDVAIPLRGLLLDILEAM